MTTELFCRNWDFSLFRRDEIYVISVVFFGTIDIHRSFVIDEGDIPGNYEELSELSEMIRNNYDSYRNSEIIPAIIKAT